MDIRGRLATITRTRTVYDYTYRIVGELAAFAVGWMVLLQHATLTSVTARVVSKHIDCFFDWTLANMTVNSFGRVDIMFVHVDFLALFTVAIATVAAMYLSVQWFHWLMVASNVVTVATLIGLLVTGLCFANFGNWDSVGSVFRFGFHGVSQTTARVPIQRRVIITLVSEATRSAEGRCTKI